MMYHLPATNDISPSLREITNLLNEENSRLPIASSMSKVTTMQEEIVDKIQTDINEKACEFEPWNFNQEDDHTSVIDDNSTNAEQCFTCHQEVASNQGSHIQRIDQRISKE